MALDQREFDEIRIRKDSGFFGVTLPITVRLEGAEPQTAANWTTPFFIANREYRIISIDSRWETASTSAIVQLRKVPSGTAPASGTALLAYGIDTSGTANTNTSPILTRTTKDLTLATGDSLSLTQTGTLGSVAGFTLSITLRAI